MRGVHNPGVSSAHASSLSAHPTSPSAANPARNSLRLDNQSPLVISFLSLAVFSTFTCALFDLEFAPIRLCLVQGEHRHRRRAGPHHRALWQERHQAQQASELQQMKSREPKTWKEQEASWTISLP